MTSVEEKIKRAFLRNEKVFSTQQVTLMFLTQQVTLHFHAMWHADDHNYLFGKFLLTRKKYIDEMTNNDQHVVDLLVDPALEREEETADQSNFVNNVT